MSPVPIAVSRSSDRRIGEAHTDQTGTRRLEAFDRDREGLARWLEARDRSLEQQLIAHRVFRAERDEESHAGLQVVERLAGEVETRLTFDEVVCTLGKHRVVDRMLRVEVRVERGRLHADTLREVAQGQGGQALGAHQLPRRIEDLRFGCLMAFGSSITSWFY